MYEAFFGFTQQPFATAPSAKRYFPAASIDGARETLARCIERREGTGLLIGPPGTGKSLLLSVLAEEFASKLAVVHLAATQGETRRELMQAILYELKLPFQGVEEGEMRLSLVDHLTRSENGPEGGVLLLVDEAHALPVPVLEELRMMTNLARGGEPQVRLILAGKMDLEEVFADPRLDAFAQRLAARCYLEPFEYSETNDFIRFQIAVAGGQADRVFDPQAADAVHRATDGIPRLVNQLCDHALLLAFHAEQPKLDASAIERAWADLQQLPLPWSESDADADDAPDEQCVIEFGSLGDDDDDDYDAPIADVLSMDKAPIADADAEHDIECLEMDFREEFALDPAADGPPAPSAKPLPPLPRRMAGCEFQEVGDKLHVIVDPYAHLDDDDEEEFDAFDSPQEDSTQAPDAKDAQDAAWACDHVTPPDDDPICREAHHADEPEHTMILDNMRSEEPNSHDSAHHAFLDDPQVRRAETSDRDDLDIGAAPTGVSLPEEAAAANLMEEEVVADPYAQLDARYRPAEEPAAFTFERTIPLSEIEASPQTAEHPEAPRDEHPDAPAEGPPEPTLDEYAVHHLMNLLNEVQLDELMAGFADLSDAGGEDAAMIAVSEEDGTDGEIVVIDDEGEEPVEVPFQGAHRVEQKDYKSLFARLRRGT